jgi:shikimate kinase
VDGYYDYHPTLQLPRPVALTGFFGAGVAEVAAIVSQRTGLSVVELDRWIEHEAGCSLSALVLERGLEELRRIEARLLPRALAQLPPALIALGDGALLREDNRRHVERAADLLYLRAELETLLPLVQREVQRSRSSTYPFVMAAPQSVDDLRPLFDDREPGYLGAGEVIDIDGRSTTDVSAQLLEELRARNVLRAN